MYKISRYSLRKPTKLIIKINTRYLPHLLIADGHHKVVCRDTKKVSKVSESHWSVGSENKNEFIDTEPIRRTKDTEETCTWYSQNDQRHWSTLVQRIWLRNVSAYSEKRLKNRIKHQAPRLKGWSFYRQKSIFGTGLALKNPPKKTHLLWNRFFMNK